MIFKFFFVLFFSISALSQETLPLPKYLQQWHVYETQHMDLNVDTRRILTGPNQQNPFYAPDNHNVFEIKGYWLSDKEALSFRSPGAATIEGLFQRTVNGQKQILLPIHPEGEGLYDKLNLEAKETRNFLSSPTSSSRTLISILPNTPPLMTKVSLNKEIYGLNRSLDSREVSRSIGTSTLLELSTHELPKDFVFFPEVFGVLPKNQEHGGAIVRLFPQQMLNGTRNYISMFALYGEPKDGSEPLLLKRLHRSSLTAEEYLIKHIIRPFALLYLELAIEHGILVQGGR